MGRFTNTQGKNVVVGEFWVKYNDTIQGLMNEPDVEFTREGIIQKYTPMLIEYELIQVICFDESWKEQNYLVETTTGWALFHWATAA